MQVKKIFHSDFIICICLILGGLTGLISNAPFVAIVPLVILGIGGSLYSLGRSNVKAREVEYMHEAQAKLFANAGLGNIYTKAFEVELRKTGSCKRASEILTKALEINPNDKDAMIMLSMTYALNLSYHQWVGDKKDDRFKKTLSFTKNLTERGIKLFPNEHSFHDSLGILLDIEGKHQKARKEFFRSGKLRADPYWRLLLSTSWLMSEKPKRAVEEIRKAIDEGAVTWMVDYYYGRSLHAMSDYKKAESFLLSALKTRGWRPELLAELEAFYYFQAKLFKSAKFAAAEGLAFLLGCRFRGLLYLVKAFGDLCIAISCTLSKFLWPFFQKRPRLWKFMFFLPSPEQPEFALSNTLIDNERYKAAENLLRKVCEIRPSKGWYFNSLAICLAKQGKRKEALLACDCAIELEPENETFRHNRKQVELGLPTEFKLIKVKG